MDDFEIEHDDEKRQTSIGKRIALATAAILACAAVAFWAFRPADTSDLESSGPPAPDPLALEARSPDTSPEGLLAACRLGGEYILAHQHADGRFDYVYDTATGETSSGYNLLRHAGTCYALAELYGATKDARYLAAAKRGIDALLASARPPKPEDRGANFEAIASGDSARLGGSALAVIAIARYQTASGDRSLLPRARALGRFLLFQQQPDGRFRTKYSYGRPSPEPTESTVYPGEAVLALTRLYGVDRDRKWLDGARRGAGWLIGTRDAGKTVDQIPHDHWLLIALDGLHAITRDRAYAEHARRISEAILASQRLEPDPPEWVGSMRAPAQSAPTASRCEALVAMCSIARRTGTSDKPYLDALRLAAAFELRCQVSPTRSLTCASPRLSVGGFRRSPTESRVRIDYVQHAVCALLGIRALLP